MRGIYLLANNRVSNQLIALLNSFKYNWPNHYPICIIPYDENVSSIVEIIKDYSNVTLYSNSEALKECDNYFAEIWQQCPLAIEAWKSKNKPIPFRLGEHRRFIAFKAGLFEQFLYIDVDTYINRSFEELFTLLNKFDIVAHDFQQTGPQHVFNTEAPRLKEVLNGELLDQIQCTGMIVSKASLVTEEHWKKLPGLVAKYQEVLYPWSADQPIWNFMFNIFKWKFVNLTRYWPNEKVTHDAQTYVSFDFRNGKLFENEKELLYFHHIGVPAEEFNRICEGKEPIHNFRYQNVFKFFRYLER